MDQEALTSPSSKKLSAKAPEFVPRSAAAAAPPPPPPLLRPVYPRPYYGFENFYQQQNVPPPFYGYSVSPVGSTAEIELEGNKGGVATVSSVKNGPQDAHRKIINQVEFYFSDINLATTDQLYKFMSKDSEGYVPLSVVASFKKIKTAVSDCAQLASILSSSNKLSVSEDGKKIKRLQPLTESDMEELQSRIVIAENLPEDHSHQNLMKIFSSVGSVKSIRTCQPQNSNGGASSASRTGKGDGMHLSSKFHAFVEYDSVEDAEKAIVELTDEGNWRRNSLKVRLLLKNAVKSTQARAKKVGHEGQTSGKKDEAVGPEMQHFKENNLEDSLLQSDAQNHELNQSEDNPKGNNNAQRKGRNYAGGNNNKGNKGKGKGHVRGGVRPQHQPINGTSSVLRSPPSEVVSMGKGSAVPRMPDGTKGFSMGRGKPI